MRVRTAVGHEQEERLFKKKYLDFIDEWDTDEVQLFFTPWYSCNFDCSYCFQDEYTNPNENVKAEVVDAFFDYIDQKFADRQKYITIFGGEPLLNSPAKRASIAQVISGANKRNLDIAIAVLVENIGDGSEFAAPIFRRVAGYHFFNTPGPLYPWENDFGVLDPAYFDETLAEEEAEEDNSGAIQATPIP